MYLAAFLLIWLLLSSAVMFREVSYNQNNTNPSYYSLIYLENGSRFLYRDPPWDIFIIPQSQAEIVI